MYANLTQYKDHPPSQTINGNTIRRITRSQVQEMQNLVTRLENFQIFRDENNEEPKVEMVNYALYSFISNYVSNTIIIEPSCYEEAYFNIV